MKYIILTILLILSLQSVVNATDLGITKRIGTDKIIHYAGCGMAQGILSTTMSNKKAFILIMSLGLLKEAIDYKADGNFSGKDILADASGAATTWLLISIHTNKVKKQYEPEYYIKNFKIGKTSLVLNENVR